MESYAFPVKQYSATPLVLGVEWMKSFKNLKRFQSLNLSQFF